MSQHDQTQSRLVSTSQNVLVAMQRYDAAGAHPQHHHPLATTRAFLQSIPDPYFLYLRITGDLQRASRLYDEAMG